MGQPMRYIIGEISLFINCRGVEGFNMRLRPTHSVLLQGLGLGLGSSGPADAFTSAKWSTYQFTRV